MNTLTHSHTHTHISALLKAELKRQGLNYADLAQRIGLAESSVKRLLAPNSASDLTFSKVDAMCEALGIEFTDLAQSLLKTRPMLQQLTHEQEAAVVADSKLILVALCVLSQWTFEQITAEYTISAPECIGYMVQLDKIGLIELRAENRYRLKLAKTFRWLPDGPMMAFFRRNAMQEYFGGNFHGNNEGLLLVHGSVSEGSAASFLERLQRVAQDFSAQHLAEQKLQTSQRQGYTLVLAMRHWEAGLLADFKRPGLKSRTEHPMA